MSCETITLIRMLAKPLLTFGLLAAGLNLGAATLTFESPSGGQHGTAVFQTSNNQLLITLTNLVANPSAVTNVLTSLQFTLEAGTYSGGSMTSSGIPRTVAKNGSYTDAGAKTTDWVYSRTLLNAVLSWNNGSGPDEGIIGDPNNSNVYGNANNSITGNGPHNPFLAKSATFTVALNGVDQYTGISNVKLGWGTSDSVLGTTIVNASCTTAGGCNPTAPALVPEPSSVFLVAAAAGLFGLKRLVRQ